jgi:hypothetical protein
MILAASAYIPPYTCQGVRQGLQARLRQEFGDLPPTKGFDEDVGQLTIGGNPFKSNFLEKQEFIDDMKLAINVPMFFLSAAITADVNRRFVVAEE